MKQTKRTTTAEPVGEIIGERDRTICLYIEWLTMGVSDIEKLTERIRKEGLARMSIADFAPALEDLGRECFMSWVEDIEGRCIATPKFADEYHKLYTRYACRIGELTRAIKEHSPNNQQAQVLAAAISRLYDEVRDAIDRGARQYLTGNGKPQPEDLLSDARHGALWDNVEKAIIELSTPRAETPLSKAEIRESEKKDLFRKQRQWCADWLKEQEKDGNKYTFGKAANEYEPTRKAEFKAHKTGYSSKASLVQGLDNFKHDLGIARFQKKRGPHKQ